MAEVTHGVMRKTEEAFTNMFDIGDDKAVIYEPEPVRVFNAVHPRRGREEFIDEWIMCVSIFDGSNDVGVKIKFRGRRTGRGGGKNGRY